jgi:hypothetical protein
MHPLRQSLPSYLGSTYVTIYTLIPNNKLIRLQNLFKRHPLCTFMVHRVFRTPGEKAAVESEGMEDPFDETQDDPMQTGAINSCLWEVVQLQSHYHPTVSPIAQIISQQFTKTMYNMEDFLVRHPSSFSLSYQITYRSFTTTMISNW